MMDLFILFSFFYMIFWIVMLCKFAKKTGYGGWKLFVPVYSYYVLMKIAGLDIYWFLLSFVSALAIYMLYEYTFIVILFYLFALFISFVYCYSLARKFNKGIGYAFGIFLLNPIFMPILTFSKKCVYSK